MPVLPLTMCMQRSNLPPHQVFVHAGPIKAESESEQQFLQRYTEQEDATDVRQVPYLLDIAGGGRFQNKEENKIVGEKQHPADPGLGLEVGSTEDGGDGANYHGGNRSVDRVPWQKIKKQKSDEGRSERLVMMAVQRLTLFCLKYRNVITMSENGIEHGTDAADAETKNQAFQIEAGTLRQVEKRWRIPVLGYEQRFGEAEWGGGQTDYQHRFSVMWKSIKRYCPRNQEC